MSRLDNPALARLTWICSAFVFFGCGVGLVWWPSAQAIGEVQTHARARYEEANNNDALVRRAADLRAAQARVRADLDALGGIRSSGEVTAAALKLLGDEARQRRVEIRSIVPSATAQTPGVLVGSDVAIGVRGPYRSVLGLIADLPRHNVLIDVHDAELISIDPALKSPTLDVTVHATFYRLTSLNNTGEVKHVRTL